MLKREDIKMGDLLCGVRKNLHPLLGELYLVIQPNGLGFNSVQVIEVTTGRKLHCGTRWFKKTDIF
tara:strand:+ start:778 stop:975 length:198 start_codon:yes stop_codon:yes gene_type:complete